MAGLNLLKRKIEVFNRPGVAGAVLPDNVHHPGVSNLTYHMSHVTCHMALVTGHVLCVM